MICRFTVYWVAKVLSRKFILRSGSGCVRYRLGRCRLFHYSDWNCVDAHFMASGQVSAGPAAVGSESPDLQPIRAIG